MCGSATCTCFSCCLQEAREHYRKVAKEIFGHAAYLELLMAFVVACLCCLCPEQCCHNSEGMLASLETRAIISSCSAWCMVVLQTSSLPCIAF